MNQSEWGNNANRVMDILDALIEATSDEEEKRLLKSSILYLEEAAKHRGYGFISLEEYQARIKKRKTTLKVVK